MVNGERVRHHHGGGKQEQEDIYVSQLEKTAMEDTSRRPSSTCPNCLYKNTPETKTANDNLRLEAIKTQILSKLGLRQKPNVTHSLPKEVIMQTLYRAEDSQNAFSNMSEDTPTTSTRTAGLETVDVDDFYGRTSEIISFAEKGKIFYYDKKYFLVLRLRSERSAGRNILLGLNRGSSKLPCKRQS